MAIHSGDSLDSVYFSNIYNNNDQVHYTNWYEIYTELRNTAYDTSILKPIDTLVSKADFIGRDDTILLGIMNVSYNSLIDTAFKTEGLFFNTTDSTISDVLSRPSNPYLVKDFFLASTLKDYSTFKNVIFKIDTNFIFIDQRHAGSNQFVDPDFSRWKIDFGDGNGWLDFDPTYNQYFNVNYPDSGIFEIKIGIIQCDVYPDCEQDMTYLSKSAILILNNSESVPADNTRNHDNFQVGTYYGCGGRADEVTKAIIFVEGFDMLDNKSIEENYFDALQKPKINELLDYGYNIYVVNWKNPFRDMKENAMDLVKVIDSLKNLQTTDDQFVVFGESMGGIISRYALTYMETDDYINNSTISPLKMHNTRLLITNDSPHQGAYVPLSVQLYYDMLQNTKFYKTLENISNSLPFLGTRKYFQDFSNSTSVKQLLLMGPNGEPHQERLDFMDDLISMNTATNGYPSYCKLMAISSGLLTGQNQIGYGEHILAGGENLIKFNYKKNVRIIYFVNIKLLDYELKLNGINKNITNSTLVEEVTTNFRIKIKGCLRSLLRLQLSSFVSCALYSTISTNTGVINKTFNEDYETVPGGNLGLISFINKIPSKKISYFIVRGEISLDENNGELKMNINYDLLTYLTLGLAQRKDNVSLKLNSFYYSFVPVKSAIDYQINDYSRNFLNNTDVPDMLNETPFDVIMGFQYYQTENETTNIYPTNIDANNFRRLNQSHTYFENLSLHDDVLFRNINREIGDKILYINNLNLGNKNRNVRFTAVDRVYYGFHNPYYESDINVPNTLNRRHTTFSKVGPFSFVEPTSVLLETSSTGGFIEGEENNLIIEGVLDLNVINFVPCDNIESPISLNMEGIYSNHKIEIYPNPIDNKINISANFDLNDSNIEIYNSQGVLYLSEKLNILEGEIKSINLSSLIPQVYIIKIYSRGINKNLKLIKN